MTTHAAPPHKMSTLSVIDGCLFAFGGKDQDNQPFATVYCYSPESNSWQGAGSMLSSCYDGVAISTVKQDQDGGSDVYVIGGYMYLGETSQPQLKIGCRIIITPRACARVKQSVLSVVVCLSSSARKSPDLDI